MTRIFFLRIFIFLLRKKIIHRFLGVNSLISFRLGILQFYNEIEFLEQVNPISMNCLHIHIYIYISLLESYRHKQIRNKISIPTRKVSLPLP